MVRLGVLAVTYEPLSFTLSNISVRFPRKSPLVHFHVCFFKILIIKLTIGSANKKNLDKRNEKLFKLQV